MTIRKTIWLTAIIILPIFSAHAQRFDWVKSYTGTDPSGYLSNYIISSLCDANGDLYILGHFSNDASMDGNNLLPVNPARPDNLNVIVAKVSSQGEVVWRKAIHSKNHNCTAYDMQLVGDTSLVCMVSIVLPTDNNDHLWYLDTMITRNEIDYLMPTDSIGSTSVCGIITLNLNGELVEHHFLQTAYIDSQGKIITYDRAGGMMSDSNRYAVRDFRAGPFCTDRYGSVYMAHVAEDAMWVMCDTCQEGGGFVTYSIENGLLSGIVILVDGHPKFSFSPEGNPSHRNYRIMKFSPHFDVLSDWQYVFDLSEDIQFEYDEGASIVVDNEGCLYLSKCVRNPTQVKDYSLNDGNGLTFRTSEQYSAYLIKYSSDMTPLYIVQPTHNECSSVLNSLTNFHTLKVDEDSTSLFVLATIHKYDQSSIVSINNNILDLDKNACFLRIDKNSGEVVSYGKAPSSDLTSFLMKKTLPGLVVKNNRVFSQIVYRNNLECNRTELNIPTGQIGKCLYIWDYSGNAISCIDYGSTSQESEGGTALTLFDSALYLSGYTSVNITFGDTTLYTGGNRLAYFARYVDTAYFYSYTSTPTEPESLISSIICNKISVFPNPTKSMVKIELPENERTRECYIISTTGIYYNEKVSENTLNLSKYPSGIYYIEIITNNNIYKHKIIKL